MSIELRPVGVDDEDFLLRVYASTREQEMSFVPWNAEQKEAFVRSQFAAQSTHYKAKYPDAEHSIICRDGEQVGRMFLARLPDVFAIADITVLPEYRNAGIGSFVLGNVLKEAKDVGKPVSIYVESFNPSLRLFERLGFSKAGEYGLHYLLKWQP